MKTRTLGLLQILLSGLCFGFLGLFGKSAYAKGATPAELLSLRFFTAGALVLLFSLVFTPRRLRLTRSQLLWSIALGVAGYAVFSYCYFRALTGLSVSLTVLLLYMYPVLVAVGAWIFLGEKIHRRRLFVLPMAMAGLVTLVWGDFYVDNAVAFGFGLASAFFYSIYILCSARFLVGGDPLISAGIMQFSAGIVLALCTWRDPARLRQVVSEIWPTVLAMALICSVAAMSLFLAGLQKLRSWEASILSTAEPITSILVAFVLLNERLSSTQIVGAALVMLAFVFVSIPPKELRHG